MPVMVNGLAVLFNEITPAPVFVALKLMTAFAFAPKVVPVPELVVNKPAVIIPAPDSLIAPVAFKLTAPEPFAVTAPPIVSDPLVDVKEIVPLETVLITPLVCNAPVFATTIFPVLLDVIPVIVNAAAFVNETPPVAFEALKLEIVLLLPKEIPVEEFVVSKPVVAIKPVPVSLIAPAVAVKFTLPLVLMPPLASEIF
jgi:hypothetical protein